MTTDRHLFAINNITNTAVRLLRKAAFNLLKKNFIYTSETAGKEAGFVMVEDPLSAARYNRLYLGNTDKLPIGRRLTFSRSKAVRQKTKEWGLSLVKADTMPLKAHEYLTIPNFVDLNIKLPADIETYKSTLPNSARYDLRKIKRAGFRSVISTDTEWVSTFYKKYYEPSMRSRHGEEAHLISECEIRTLMLCGNYEFVNVFEGEICVGSVMAEHRETSYSFFKVGWLNADVSLLNKGAAAAMYWCTIKRAFELNCNELLLGGTPTYLESGVFKYKSKWLATLSSNYHGLNQMLLNPDNPNCYNFLKKFSLLALNQNNSFIVLSSKTKAEMPVTGIVLNDVTAWYILLDSKLEHPDDSTAELPAALQCWYRKCNDHIAM